MPSRHQRWQDYRIRLPLRSRFILSFTINRLYNIRNEYASRYITGNGYEIGAQNAPLKCDNADKVTYIDYLSRKESSQKYNISENECVEVDIIADANNLNFIPSDSASFVIANHVLEHSPNPIATLQGWLRILKTGGMLFLTLPNYKSNEFDFEKSLTGITHLVQDNERAKNSEDITTEHINEHIRIIDGIDPDNKKLFEQRYKDIVRSNLHTHYHVFNRDNVLDLLHFIHLHTPIHVVNTFSFDNSIELLYIIKKAAPGFEGTLTVRRNRSFNNVVLLKHIIIFLFKRVFLKRP